MARQLVGFSFTVREGEHTRRVRLMGCGGLLGAGFLGTSPTPAKVRKVRADLRIRAESELVRCGCVREWLGDDFPPEQQLRNISPDTIEACEAAWERR